MAGRLLRVALAAATLFAAALLVPPAGGARADTAGLFDFYVLSLSWSPSYCASRRDGDPLQCGAGRPFAFIVHGLWPQYERGYPQSCATGGRAAPSRREIDGMLDIMPSRALVRHQWRKHGSCSGLDPAGYFALTRKARERIAIPDGFERLDEDRSVAPVAVEAAFVAANPGLPAEAIAVTCSDRRLAEVRVCLTRDLAAFRPCPEVDRRACRAASVAMPPVRR
ncbi:ribonuclease T2 family protein [Prosthecomicrobium pneumaticum]|uniref:Ribonuclease T2 n=1 Tax=Prosthecomicrobium pneumaticum TaxID=81895 RepID=A0A7W9CTP8_9HYPH|nr:ribonuclease T2 [Prosthecomicrobium pneumaticum]MBB5751459.1 ribonuclease T2 [Prosthecomicrobium pneumaticum]